MPASLTITLSVVVAAVFAAAAFAKARDRHGTIRMLMAFGLPEGAARPAAIVLPAAEAMVAAAVVVPATSPAGAMGALCLLVVFSLAIAGNLLRGRRPDCQCFGQAHATPIGWRPLARNAALAAAAVYILVTSRAESGGESSAWVAVAAGVAIVAAGTWIAKLTARVRALEQQQSSSPTPIPDVGTSQTATAPSSTVAGGLAVGTLAPGFVLSHRDGGTISLASLVSRGRAVLLVFSDPNCGPCARLIPELADWETRLAAIVTIAVISRGSAAQHAGTTVTHLLLQKDTEVLKDYRVAGTPTAVIVQPDGTIGTPLAPGELNIARLLDDLDRQATAMQVMTRAAADAPATVTAPPLTPDTAPTKADCVHDELLPDGSVVLYNACRRQALTLNATGALIWECCDGAHAAAGIAGVVREVFPAAADADRDVLLLLQQLREAGMITIDQRTLATVE